MNFNKVLLLLVTLVLIALVVWLQGFAFALLWNLALVPLLGLPAIGTVHGIVISLLLGLFFDKITRI